MPSDSPLIDSRASQIAADAILVIAAFLALFPFLWIAWTAIKPASLAFQPGATDFTPTIESFQLMMARDPVHIYLLNTLLLASVTTVLALAVGGFAAYSIARFNTGGSKMKISFLLPVMVPPIAFSLAMFFAWDSLGIGNSRIAIVMAYMTFAIPFAVVFLTAYFEEFPTAIEEAAMVDGDTRIGAVINVVIPNLKPAFFATGILIFIYSWNNFIFPFLLTTDSSLRTLPVLVSTYVTSDALLASHMSAAVIITVVPVLVLATFLGKYLIEGVNAESGID